MPNVKLVVAYDGQAYLGWQKIPKEPSIEATLQGILEKILQHSITLQAASRTDAGVHAQGQVVNFLTPKQDLHLNCFRLSINALLPKDIRVLRAEYAALTFHPTLEATGKEYRYFVCCGDTQLPHHRLYSWHVPHSLNLSHMRQALPLLKGWHNFASFCNLKKTARYTDYIRCVQELTLLELPEQRLCFSLKGNHFLYKMARNLVGTLIDIGRGRISLERLSTILTSQQRLHAGVTAPAHGLFLYQVFYETAVTDLRLPA